MGAGFEPQLGGPGHLLLPPRGRGPDRRPARTSPRAGDPARAADSGRTCVVASAHRPQRTGRRTPRRPRMKSEPGNQRRLRKTRRRAGPRPIRALKTRRLSETRSGSSNGGRPRPRRVARPWGRDLLLRLVLKAPGCVPRRAARGGAGRGPSLPGARRDSRAPVTRASAVDALGPHSFPGPGGRAVGCQVTLRSPLREARLVAALFLSLGRGAVTREATPAAAPRGPLRPRRIVLSPWLTRR